MKTATVWLTLLVCAVTMLVACGGSSAPQPGSGPAPLNAANTNLIFVVSEDVAYQTSGDVSAKTGNLTSQGLQRSLLLGSFVRSHLLGMQNVTRVYALQPMTHLQTTGNYPDMAALETAQNFGLLNQVSLFAPSEPIYTGNSYPLNVSYGSNSVPAGVAPPLLTCSECQGLDFKNQRGANETLVTGIIKAKQPGFYVFSAPWETTSSLLQKIDSLQGYRLPLPASYGGPNLVYAISITPAGSASLVTYDSNLHPLPTYPVLPASAIVRQACNATHFTIAVTGGVDEAVTPAAINTNETVYFVRHAEAHPVNYFEDGNYVCAGQWRALALPNALRGKIAPDQVYSIDPAQLTPGANSTSGMSAYSYVRPSLTVAPYAIANGVPYNLAANFEMAAQNPPQLATDASAFFFNGGQFSNQTLLVAWEHDHIPTTVNALLASFHGNNQPAPNWPDDDYDTIWTVKLDPEGNVTVDNAKCEGIKSATLPGSCPQF
jgi:hypothetical protein